MKMFKFTVVEFNHTPMFIDWDKEHKYPHYNITERYELPPMKFDDLWDAEEWLVKTYPQYCIGYSIGEVDEFWRSPVKGGSFSCDAVLDHYVGEYGIRDIDAVYKRAYEDSLRSFDARNKHK